MNSDSAILDPAGERVLTLDFEMPLAVYVDLTQELSWMSRHRLLVSSFGVFQVALGVLYTTEYFGSDRTDPTWVSLARGFGVFFMIFYGWLMATNNELGYWLSRRFSRGVSHTELELDSDGIRGVFEYPSGWHKEPEVKHISYSWRKVRKIHRPSGYVLLEFHGGGTVTIPEREFETYGDVGQCLEWAEDGLAAQRKKKAFRHVAA